MSNYVLRNRNYDLFDGFLEDEKLNRLMKTDISENEKGYLLEIDLPGYNKEDIKVNFEKGYLTITAETKKEIDDNKKHNFIRHERYLGHVTRTYYLGDEIKEEDIKANFKDGVLLINVPKKDSKEVQTKKYISIE